MVVAATALSVAACSSSSEDDYKGEFEPINQELVKLGEQVGDTIEGAGESSDEQLADDFGNHAEDLGDLQQDLDELEPPDDLAEDQDELVASMGDVQGSLEDIAEAAEQGDPDSARQGTVNLIQRSEELRTARRTLARAVRDL